MRSLLGKPFWDKKKVQVKITSSYPVCFELLRVKRRQPYIRNALRDLVPFAQFKKREKTPMEEC